MDSARTPITPYPRGWFLVARSGELRPKQVKTVHYFGQDIVLYRTADGVAHAVDPFCPHLGAHLGHGGRIENDAIRCPFHGWAYDGASGACVHAPEASKTPRVSLRHWHVQEVSGMILVWYHEQDEAPTWKVPEMPEEDGRWTGWMESRWKLKACCQDVVENDIDVAHIPAMHGFSKKIPRVDFTTDGPMMRIDSTLRLELEQFGLWGAIEGPLTTRKWGLTVGYIVFTSTLMGFPIGLRTLGNTTPIDEEHVDLRLWYSRPPFADSAARSADRPAVPTVLRSHGQPGCEDLGEQDVPPVPGVERRGWPLRRLPPLGRAVLLRRRDAAGQGPRARDRLDGLARL